MQDPHDMLFRHVFSDPREAGALLRHALPPALADDVDWTSLTPAPDVLVRDGVLPQPPRTVLLFTARRRSGGLAIYLLLERRCGWDAAGEAELADVIGRVAHRHRELNPHDPEPPIVVPVVVNHGPPAKTELPAPRRRERSTSTARTSERPERRRRRRQRGRQRG